MLGPMTRTMAARGRDGLTRADGSPIRALVVDDEPSLGELLSTVLRYEGWQVESALTGHAAMGPNWATGARQQAIMRTNSRAR